MSFLLDTCVISEMMKPQPTRSVIDWIESQSEMTLYLSALTLAEIQRGVAKLPRSRKRNSLEVWLHDDLPDHFERRVLPVDKEVAITWGHVMARSEKKGRKILVLDGLIAATAIANDLIVVTRNVEDMAPTGVELFDPWE